MPDEAGRGWGWFVLFLAGFAAAKIAYVWVFPFGLSGDESYYWEWGRRPALGYFSKPPLIGWLMALGYQLGADVFGIRTMAALFGAGALGFLFCLGRSMFGLGVAWKAALVFAVVPGTIALNLILTIDAPLVFFWTGSMWLSWLWLDGSKGRLPVGIALTILLGLGYLTKQMMWFFPLLVLGAILANPSWRGPFFRRGRWVPFAISYFALAPLVWWNVRQEWILLEHTATHFGSGNGFSPALQASRFGEFVGSQLLLLGPVLLVLLVWVCLRVVRRFSEASAAQRFLFVFSAPGLAVFLILALTQRVLPNWPLVFYPAGILLAVSLIRPNAASESWKGGGIPGFRKWFRPVFVSGAILSALLLASPFLVSPRVLATGLPDPFTRLRGWDEFAREVESVARREGLGTWLTVGHRYVASQLAFHSESQPRVFRWSRSGEVESQYELWPPPTGEDFGDMLVVVGDGRDGLPSAFEEFRSLETIEIQLPDGKIRKYFLYGPPEAEAIATARDSFSTKIQ